VEAVLRARTCAQPCEPNILEHQNAEHRRQNIEGASAPSHISQTAVEQARQRRRDKDERRTSQPLETGENGQTSMSNPPGVLGAYALERFN
jgi:hypothetical protein